MAQVQCLYCDTTNDAIATGGFCDNCGKKLPASALVRTKRNLASFEESDARSETGGMARVRYRAAEAIAVAAVVHLVVGGVFMMIGPALFSPAPPDTFLSLVVTWTLIPSLVLGGVALLARSMARPATLVALALGVAWIGVTFALNLDMALRWLIVQVVLLALLTRAVLVSIPARGSA